ncbi:cGMP-dependent protein kinase 1 [Schistosoma japonicum]|nr:cGMP-dependent protein kinase 1 [Schistosoma japonicum]
MSDSLLIHEKSEDHTLDIKPNSIGCSSTSSGGQKHGLIKKLLNRTNSNNSNSTGNSSHSEKLKILELRSHRRPQQIMGNVHQSNPVNATGGSASGASYPSDETSINKQNKSVLNTKSHNKQLTIQTYSTNPQSSFTNDTYNKSPTGNIKPPLISGINTTTVSSSNNNTNIINGLIGNSNTSNPTTPTTMLSSSPSTNETIVQLQEMIAHLKAVVSAKDQRIQELERDKDKLRSVLHQQLTSSWS